MGDLVGTTPGLEDEFFGVLLGVGKDWARTRAGLEADEEDDDDDDDDDDEEEEEDRERAITGVGDEIVCLDSVVIC